MFSWGSFKPGVQLKILGVYKILEDPNQLWSQFEGYLQFLVYLVWAHDLCGRQTQLTAAQVYKLDDCLFVAKCSTKLSIHLKVKVVRFDFSLSRPSLVYWRFDASVTTQSAGPWRNVYRRNVTSMKSNIIRGVSERQKNDILVKKRLRILYLRGYQK